MASAFPASQVSLPQGWNWGIRAGQVGPAGRWDRGGKVRSPVLTGGHHLSSPRAVRHFLLPFPSCPFIPCCTEDPGSRPPGTNPGSARPRSSVPELPHLLTAAVLHGGALKSTCAKEHKAL